MKVEEIKKEYFKEILESYHDPILFTDWLINRIDDLQSQLKEERANLKLPADVLDFLHKLRLAEHESIRADSVKLFRKYNLKP